MSFDPHRFHAAAAHYRGGRIPYPPKLIRRVADLVDLGENDRVLDLAADLVSSPSDSVTSPTRS